MDKVNNESRLESDVKNRRETLEKELGVKFSHISIFSQNLDEIINHNCENVIGFTQIPLGVAGPILINKKKHYLPLATTEGALLASVNRGAKITSLAGGIKVVVEDVGITRGPVFKTKGILESHKFVEWIHGNIDKLRVATESTSRHLKLIEIEDQIVGKNVFLRFIFNSDNAMGMNMATIATSKVGEYIKQNYEEADLVAISGNYCVDKKASWLNFTRGRGKKVWAEATIRSDLVKKILHTTPASIVEVAYRKNLIGSAISGSMGFNAHFANIVAGVFIATGQDAAHVTEGSLGITTAELEKNNDLFFSIYMPDVICGTIGGGTHLKTQEEALQIMQVKSSSEFATVLGAGVLAGELSLLASLAEGSLVSAHEKLGRGKK